MVEEVSFEVEGTPVPQGSKNGYVIGKRAVIVDSNKDKLKPWREEIAKASDLGVTFDSPVYVRAVFRMPMPKKPKFPVPAVKPDLDKLQRALFDGMKDGGLISDDSRIVSIIAKKVYSEFPGVEVTVRSLDED